MIIEKNKRFRRNVNQIQSSLTGGIFHLNGAQRRISFFKAAACCIIALCMIFLAFLQQTIPAKGATDAVDDSNVRKMTEILYWAPSSVNTDEILDAFYAKSKIVPIRIIGIDKNGKPVDENHYSKEAEIREINANDALSFLENGEIEVVFGLTEQYCRGKITASCTIFDSCLTAVSLWKNDDISQADADKCYWGIENPLQELLCGTPFDGHTIDFGSGYELEKALSNGDVYGILVRKEDISAKLLNGEATDFKVLPMRISYKGCILMNIEDENVRKLLENSCMEYAKTHDITDYESAQYPNMLSSTLVVRDRLTAGLIVTGMLLLLLATAAIYLFYRLKKTVEYDEKKISTLLMADPDKELFEVNLETNTIYAYKNFALLGENETSNLKNPVDIGELSKEFGMDFAMHFAEGINTVNHTYRNRLVLHRRGKKMLLSENGKVTGNILLITITEVHISNEGNG